VYGFQHVGCQLITATLRNVYLVESHAGRHILTVHRHGQRTWDEIAVEWRFMDSLARHAIPGAAAVATTSGEQILRLLSKAKSDHSPMSECAQATRGA
jgi:Ser/Thr protein kinase RdoA (MazF antagonist)